MLDTGLAQLTCPLDPVGAPREQHAAGPHRVHAGIIDTRGTLPVSRNARAASINRLRVRMIIWSLVPRCSFVRS